MFAKGANAGFVDEWGLLLDNAKNGREYYMNAANRSYVEDLRDKWKRGYRLNDREREILYAFGNPEEYGGMVTNRANIY